MRRSTLAILAIGLLSQSAAAQIVAPLPEIKLNIPPHTVGYGRSVKMSIDPFPSDKVGDSTIVATSVDWDVTDRRSVDNPLDNDLDIDSNTMKGIIPSGMDPTTVKISVTVTFALKGNDGVITLRKASKSGIVSIGKAFVPIPPGPDVVPDPPIVVPPSPGPGPIPEPPVIVPTPQVEPVFPTTARYKFAPWVYGTLKEKKLPQADAVALAAAFRRVPQLIANGAYKTITEAQDASVEQNRNALGANVPAWTPFMNELGANVTRVSVGIRNVTDYATVCNEIADGLEGYAGTYKP